MSHSAHTTFYNGGRYQLLVLNNNKKNPSNLFYF